jgi:integrase
VSTEIKRTNRTKRRDSDPVRVYDNGRLWYWTGGRPGKGIRTPERCGSREAAEARAAELRVKLARTHGRGRHPATTLDQLMQDLLIHLRRVGDPEGSIRAYKTNWNRWVPEEVGTVRCFDVALQHWSAILTHLDEQKASEPVVRNVTRTLGVALEFGLENGYFPTDEPFGAPRRRHKRKQKSLKRARIHQAEKAKKITAELCPTLADVEKLATAFEAEYPGYGRRLVLLAFASGLRINELLALRHDSFDLDTCEIAVDWQLNRYQHWPAVARPKGGKTRTAIFWRHYRPIVESLIADARARGGEDHGWIFPRHRSTVGWADQASKLGTAAKKASDWDWSFHWLRHAWASLSLAPRTVGGYGLDPQSVSEWLGHAKLSTTLDLYVVAQQDATATAMSLIAGPPGVPGPRTEPPA